MRFIILLSLFSLVALMVACSESFTDPRDGQSYDIVQIGSQTWMAENLNYEAEGSACPEGDDRKCSKYGRLYNWDMARTVCLTARTLKNLFQQRVAQKLLAMLSNRQAVGSRKETARTLTALMHCLQVTALPETVLRAASSMASAAMPTSGPHRKLPTA